MRIYADPDNAYHPQRRNDELAGPHYFTKWRPFALGMCVRNAAMLFMSDYYAEVCRVAVPGDEAENKLEALEGE